MKNLKTSLASLILPVAATLIFIQPAYPAVTTITAGVLVENLAHDITANLNSTIKQMESSASVTTFNGRSDLLVVLDNVKNLSNDLIGKTFGELNNSQKDFFERANKFATETANGIGITTERIDDLVNDLGDSLSRIPAADRSPYVSKYTPSYVFSNKAPKDIVIRGTLLATGNPSLIFNGKSCETKVKTERELRFECPSENFPETSKWVTGSLIIEEKQPWYLSFKQFKQKHYTVSVASIPNKFAEYSLETYTTEKDTRIVDRSQDNSHMNEHCQGPTPVTWTYTPSSGCDIDITSVLAPAGQSSQSSYSGVQSLTKSGFMVTGVVRNSGSCAPRIFGQRAYLDGRGNLGVNARWKDICVTSFEKPQTTQSGNLFWQSQQSFNLPQNLSKFILTVKQSNGEIHVVTGTDSHTWFSAEFDRVAKMLVIRPKSIDLAFK